MRLPLLILHILAGTVGVLSGTFAIAVRKGSRLHRPSGNIFTVAMLTLACSALCLAIKKSQHGNIIGSFITFYMIATAWLDGRRRGIGRLDLAALLVGAWGAVAVIALGIWNLHHPDKNAPAPMCFFMAAVLLLAAAGDIRMFARGSISGRPRVTRHLWRMCFGLFIRNWIFLPWPATGLSGLPARLHLPYDPRRSAIPIDDLLAHSRPIQQCIQNATTVQSDCRGSLKPWDPIGCPRHIGARAPPRSAEPFL